MKNYKAILLDKLSIERSLIRLAHEIIENNNDFDKVALIGIRTRGDYLSKRIHKLIEKIADCKIPIGTIDVTFHRDDFRTNLGSPKVGASNILFDVDDKNIILIDDVLYTGRTIRAALNELFSFGRPSEVKLGVLVDRGHREVPIKADFVGLSLSTTLKEHISVELEKNAGVYLS